MKKILWSTLLLVLLVTLPAVADEFQGYALSNATPVASSMAFMPEGIQWSPNSVAISGTVINRGQNEARFIRMSFVLLDETGKKLAERTVKASPQHIKARAYGKIDAYIDCPEKPYAITYEIFGM